MKAEILEFARHHIKWIILIPLLTAATLVYMHSCGGGMDYEQSSGSEALSPEESVLSESVDSFETSTGAGLIYIDVEGSVLNPGVVSVEEGSRVFEAIDAAGGAAADAATEYLNLAETVSDGTRIYIPSKDEVSAGYGTDGSWAGSSALQIYGEGSSSSVSTSASGSNGLVNINTAGTDELETLSGIGPSMAQRIVDYRNTNGRFASVEDITNVSGIGEKTLSKFIDKICV